MLDNRLSEVPKILETPKERGSEADKNNLKILRLLAQGEACPDG
jgi:endonuclease IV